MFEPAGKQQGQRPLAWGTAALSRQYSILTERAGFYPVAGRRLIRFVGGDRIAFLHGTCSNDVRGLAEGGVCYALFLTEHAHVVADCYIWRAPDAVLVEIESEHWPAARAQLERLLVADDVEFEEQTALCALRVEGPRAREALSLALGAGALPVEPWRWVEAQAWLVACIAGSGIDGFTVFSSQSSQQALVAGLSGQGIALPVEPESAEILRVEQGIARVGVDTGEKTLALEARLERAISFSKGCYVGQETVERATARGGVKKRLMGLRFAAPEPAAAGSAVMFADKEVGRVTSAAVSPRIGAIGLAMLHQSAWTPGITVTVTDGQERREATVSELPLAPPSADSQGRQANTRSVR